MRHYLERNSTLKITKQFTFHAAHRDAEADDQCGRLHGHTYKLEITVEGQHRYGDQMMLHGDALKEIYASWISPHVDHHYLNETLAPINPTMENTVMWANHQVRKGLEAMLLGDDLVITTRLWETPTMHAECVETASMRMQHVISVA